MNTFRKTLKLKVEEKEKLHVALFEAIKKGNIDFLSKNIHLIDFNEVNEKGQNALMLASKYSRARMVEVLIGKGGKDLVNSIDKSGRHSLSILLFKLSKDFKATRDRSSQKVLVNKAFKVVRLLVRNGADVNKLDSNNKKPRYYSRLIWKLTRRYTKKIDRYLKDQGAKR